MSNTEQTVIAENVSGIYKITLNRPHALNCLNPQMIDELSKALKYAAREKSINVIILQGAGHHFMAGGDLHYFKQKLAERENMDVEHWHALVACAQDLIREIYDLKKPVIAAVEGVAAGYGLSLVAACDFAIATEKTVFTTAYSAIGLSPDGGASFILPRVLGVKKAKELLMLADQFEARAALDYGLINQVVSEDHLVTVVNKLAVRLQHSARHALAQIKTLTNSSMERSLSEQLEAERYAFVSCAQKEDFKIGIEAFVQKKMPKFSGKC